MKLTFLWIDAPGGGRCPVCMTDLANSKEEDLVARVLDDDGGLGVEMAIQWIEEGKRLANEALAGASGPLYWAREYFGVEILGHQTIASDHHDLVNRVFLPTEAFALALQRWQEFLIAGPSAESHTVEINVC